MLVVFTVSRNLVQNFNLSLADVFTCIKLGDILNDQNAFRDNPPSLPACVQGFSLKTETLSFVCWNFAGETYSCTMLLVYWQGLTNKKQQKREIIEEI